ncbi:MAG: hypothetical protein WC273_06910 [Dehalococcoidia bacterium]
MDTPADWEDWWEELRFVTLDEAKAMECNRCGECCSSLRAPGGGMWSWGGLPPGRHYGLITLLDERTLKPRAWQPGDDHPRAHNAYDCTALEILDNDTTNCRIYGSARQPSRCLEFPVFYEGVEDDLAAGPILLRTEPLSSCTWYMMIVLPDDSPILDWRRRDLALPWIRLSARRRETAYEVIREAERLRDAVQPIPRAR